MFRKLLLAALFVGTLMAVSSPSAATQNNPHHEQEDGCDHGATGKPCKADPQPDHGQECETHGNHGGENEDHCLNTTTTTVPPTTTTTAVPSSDTTTTSTTAPSLQRTTIPTDSPITTTPSLGCMTPDGQPYLTNVEQGGCPDAITVPSTAPIATTQRTDLPHTGWDAGLLFVIGTAVLLAGLSCWACGKAIE